ncbi:MAG: RES family NAD+ phosphorylase [Anaerolineales bacterium]|nr:RES family NAD+ phosphorylase [Anaerolineales bacterium]
MAAWKLIPKRHQGEAFSGEGARIAAGRWNGRGVRAVYLSGTLSLAALEMLVYAGRAAFTIPLAVFKIEIPPEIAVDTLPPQDLPANWRQQPPPESTRRIGSAWIEGGTAAVLRVPSVLIPEDWTLLLNPAHPVFSKIHIPKPQVFRF